MLCSCRYVLFENAMSIVKLNAVIAGAFNLKGVNEWVSRTYVLHRRAARALSFIMILATITPHGLVIMQSGYVHSCCR
jgi:uncharacterized membrane protein YgdD (TMEM256/DUF423 family)